MSYQIAARRTKLGKPSSFPISTRIPERTMASTVAEVELNKENGQSPISMSKFDEGDTRMD
ncbi:hypothetical protein ACO22_00450 [Paracoccidioides brasiliensis]|uniref:Uncharacterized protein n=1 Tax=Paracoccidioides brasiliensis TaxID=121759 RepID=A0A1D2JPE3_PARBR|nr:hypothetical protein ACO22_00450 [Paracoccidioides brasiliensis]